MENIINLGPSSGIETFKNCGLFKNICGRIFLLGIASRESTKEITIAFEDVENNTMRREEKSWHESQVVMLLRNYPDLIRVDLGNFFQLRYAFAFIHHNEGLCVTILDQPETPINGRIFKIK